MATVKKFTREMVERTIKYFGSPSSVDETDRRAMKEFLADYVKFERVIERGLIAEDARELAEDFVAYAQQWIRKNNFQSVYSALKN